MSLEGDITTGDGEAIPPNTQFTKTWRVKNSGTVHFLYPIREMEYSTVV